MVRILGVGAVILSLTAAAWSGETDSVPREVPASTRATVVNFARGDVIIMSAPNGRDVIVALDETADGVSERVFLLQRNSDLDASLARLATAIRLNGASLRFDRNSLQVLHHDFSASFSVENGAYTLGERVASGSVQPNLAEFRAVLTGYGLQRSSGSWEMSVTGLQKGAAEGFACGVGREAANGVPISFASSAKSPFFACAAGGEGATECSIGVGPGSCSVSCTEGYYACCNMMGGCKCNPYQIRPAPEG